MHPSGLIALRHLLVNDPAARSHPLHITSTDHAAVADAVAMLHRSGQHVCDGLDSAVRMPRKAGQIVLWNIIAEIVQQEEWIELFCVPETECTAEMHTRTFKSRFRFDKPLNRSDRHTGLQCRKSLPFNVGYGAACHSLLLPLRVVHVFPYTGTAVPFMSFAS